MGAFWQKIQFGQFFRWLIGNWILDITCQDLHTPQTTHNVYVRCIIFSALWNREWSFLLDTLEAQGEKLGSKYRTKQQSNPLGISADIPQYLYHESPGHIPSLEAYVHVSLSRTMPLRQKEIMDMGVYHSVLVVPYLTSILRQSPSKCGKRRCDMGLFGGDGLYGRVSEWPFVAGRCV
jgi:hypothetical protein